MAPPSGGSLSLMQNVFLCLPPPRHLQGCSALGVLFVDGGILILVLMQEARVPILLPIASILAVSYALVGGQICRKRPAPASLP